MREKSRLPGLILGLVFIGFGLFFLSGLFEWLNINSILGDFWPILIIFLGLFVMSLPNNDIVGFGISMFGFLLLLHSLGLMNSSFSKTIEVICFILLGLVVIALVSAHPKQPK